jgi:hypothetical protein
VWYNLGYTLNIEALFMSLAVKKNVLISIIVILIVGNATRLVSTVTGVQVNDFGSPVRAETSFESDFRLPPNSTYNYESLSLLTIDRRIEDIDLNPEHIRKIEAYLGGRGAPLASKAYYFEKMAVKYNLPYNMMPAISVVESSGGLHCYRPYNYAGMGGQGAAMSFNNFEEAIEKHAQILRYGYFDGGADTPAEIAPYYCPPCTTWHTKVESVMYQIDSM